METRLRFLRPAGSSSPGRVPYWSMPMIVAHTCGICEDLRVVSCMEETQTLITPQVATYITNSYPAVRISNTCITKLHHHQDPTKYMQPDPSKTRQARVRPTCTYMYPPSHPTAYPFTEPSKASYMHHYLSLRYTKEEYGTCRTRTGLEVVCCHRLRDREAFLVWA